MTRDKTIEVVKDEAIAGAIGPVVGAASGGILGLGGGALYGVNENRKNDEHYREAYASMRRWELSA